MSSEAATLYKGTKIGQLVPMDDNIMIAGIAQGPDVDSIQGSVVLIVAGAISIIYVV